MESTPAACAHEVLEVVPLVMRAIRKEMRQHGAAELSVPHFRALVFLSRHEGASLSAVAEHLGLSRPTTSDLIDTLLQRGLVARSEDPADRRRVTLTLTQSGRDTMESARQATQSRLAEMLAALSPGERDVVAQAMLALRPLFTPGAVSPNGKES